MTSVEPTARETQGPVYVCSMAKVASSTFLHSLRPHRPVEHNHSLLRLRARLKADEGLLVVCGVRQPADRENQRQDQDHRPYGNPEPRLGTRLDALDAPGSVRPAVHRMARPPPPETCMTIAYRTSPPVFE